MNVDQDLVFPNYQIAMEEVLRNNDLFFHFELAIGKLLALRRDKELVFEESKEGRFAEEVISRILEESRAYIGCLKTGAFFAANHHTRALIELYSCSAIVDSELGLKKRMLERFTRFPEIVAHKIYIQHPQRIIHISPEIAKKFMSTHAKLDEELCEIFGKDKKTLLKLESWRGGYKLEQLLDLLPAKEVHKRNFDILCLYSHFSSFIRSAKTQEFPEFGSSDERMLVMTIKYAFDSYLCIKTKKFFNEDCMKKLDEAFSSIAPTLVTKLKEGHKEKLGSNWGQV